MSRIYMNISFFNGKRKMKQQALPANISDNAGHHQAHEVSDIFDTTRYKGAMKL